ncbi:MAG: hypothetical protein ACD_19C00260G0001, partial [uncultured bacterium]
KICFFFKYFIIDSINVFNKNVWKKDWKVWVMKNKNEGNQRNIKKKMKKMKFGII